MQGATTGARDPPAGLRRHVTRRTATLLVVANIIGAGIFTTTGFQAADIGHPLVILGLWLLGGVVAICGALAYGELGAAMPSAGGEYVYLRRTYGGVFGFMSAFVSLVAGFSAPIASVVKGLIGYLAPFAPVLAEGPDGPGGARRPGGHRRRLGVDRDPAARRRPAAFAWSTG